MDLIGYAKAIEICYSVIIAYNLNLSYDKCVLICRL